MRDNYVRHGESKTPLYRVWNAMKQRCLQPTTDCYHRYGGRGITVCAAWMTYLPFRDWALANGYKAGLLLDRENNDGNYEPSNCRWATSTESGENKINVKLHPDDVRVIRSLSELGIMAIVIAALYNINARTVSEIKYRHKWKHIH